MQCRTAYNIYYLYRIRIGTFQQRIKRKKGKAGKIKRRNSSKIARLAGTKKFMKLALNLLLFLALYGNQYDDLASTCWMPSTQSGWGGVNFNANCLGEAAVGGEPVLKLSEYIVLGRNQTSNFMARYLHGNIRRGVVNMHVNIRSLYNKMGEVKNLVKQEKPHILGISESELRRNHHDINSLKIPGYDVLLPKSWDVHDKARVVVYIKKSLEYEHLPDLEHVDIQSIWLKAGFKNSKKVYYSHQYREHTNTLGNSLAAQRTALDKMLMQWEAAVMHGTQDTPNEVHIAGDMNVDCLKGKWLEPGYSLVTLGRMVVECCNSNNFTQMVDKITRIQYNSIKN